MELTVQTHITFFRLDHFVFKCGILLCCSLIYVHVVLPAVAFCVLQFTLCILIAGCGILLCCSLSYVHILPVVASCVLQFKLCTRSIAGVASCVLQFKLCTCNIAASGILCVTVYAMYTQYCRLWHPVCCSLPYVHAVLPVVPICHLYIMLHNVLT